MLAPGGAIANLMSLLCARHFMFPDVKEVTLCFCCFLFRNRGEKRGDEQGERERGKEGREWEEMDVVCVCVNDVYWF